MKRFSLFAHFLLYSAYRGGSAGPPLTPQNGLQTAKQASSLAFWLRLLIYNLYLTLVAWETKNYQKCLYSSSQRPNLKNLSRGLNLRRARIWLVPLKIVFNVLRLKPALNWNRLLADLRRGSNSLNSEVSATDKWKKRLQLYIMKKKCH